MPNSKLDEREFELINIIGADLASNQRDLSRHMDLSLGATNMLVRRLIAKGYIRIGQLNERKFKYILTPKGFAEKMRKSVKYTLKTIQSIGFIKDAIRRILLEEYQKGMRKLLVLGKSDFAFLIEMVLREEGIKDYEITYVEQVPDGTLDGLLLNCRENFVMPPGRSERYIDLIHELAKEPHFINNRKE